MRRSSVIIGASVSLQGGQQLGKIEEFVIDENGCLEYVVVAYEEKYIAVPWAVARFDFGRKTLLLDIERSRLAQLPTFTEFSVLSTREFRQKNETFFGGGRGDRKTPVPAKSNEGDDQGEDKSPATKKQPGTEPQPQKQKTPATPSTQPRKTAPGTSPGKGPANPSSGKSPSSGGTQPSSGKGQSKP